MWCCSANGVSQHLHPCPSPSPGVTVSHHPTTPAHISYLPPLPPPLHTAPSTSGSPDTESQVLLLLPLFPGCHHSHHSIAPAFSMTCLARLPPLSFILCNLLLPAAKEVTLGLQAPRLTKQPEPANRKFTPLLLGLSSCTC